MATMTWVLVVLTVMCAACQAYSNNEVEEKEKRYLIDTLVKLVHKMNEGSERKRNLELKKEEERQEIRRRTVELMQDYIKFEKRGGFMIMSSTGALQIKFHDRYDEATLQGYSAAVITLVSATTAALSETPSEITIWTNKDDIAVNIGSKYRVWLGNEQSAPTYTVAGIIDDLSGGDKVAFFNVDADGVVGTNALTHSDNSAITAAATSDNANDQRQKLVDVMTAANALVTSTVATSVRFIDIESSTYEVMFAASGDGSRDGLMWIIS